jgi:hypothetical protein
MEEDDPSPEGEGSSKSAEMHAASAFARAIKSGDPKRIAATFRTLKYACEEDNGSPDDILG